MESLSVWLISQYIWVGGKLFLVIKIRRTTWWLNLSIIEPAYALGTFSFHTKYMEKNLPYTMVILQVIFFNSVILRNLWKFWTSKMFVCLIIKREVIKDRKRMLQEVQIKSISKLLSLFWRHTSASVLCSYTKPRGKNAYNLGTQL